MFVLKRASWRISYEILPGERDLGDDKLTCPGFQRKLTSTRAQILGEYEVLLVLVTGISKPGNTREYPGNW